MPYRLFSILAVFVALSSPAYAYLDPGVGSFMLQMIVAGALAVGATLKMYWYRIKSFCQTALMRQKPPTGDQ